VPLGVVIVLLIVALIAWLLERRVDSVWDPALRIATPLPAAVTLTPGPPALAAAAVPEPVVAPPAPAPLVVPARPPVPVEPPALPPEPAAAPAAAVDRYVLESGPFTSADAADRIEDQLNRLGFSTVRFRKQEVRRFYVVAAVGFASARDARRAAAELGRGVVVDGEDGLELLIERLPSFHEAVAAGRSLRARGFDVRVEEELSPAVIYHLRYGQFDSQPAADARSGELALFGLSSRVVKVR
jgi:hypothetical protein